MITKVSFAQNTISKESSLALKTNLATLFLAGIPFSIEVSIGKKQFIVSDMVISTRTEYKDQFFRGGIHQRATFGYRQYISPKVDDKNFREMEGIFVQPSV